MSNTKLRFNDLLKLVELNIHPLLISNSYIQAIQRISENLPAFSWACFECRLDSEDSRVDLIVSIAKNELKYFKDYKEGTFLASIGNQNIGIIGNIAGKINDRGSLLSSVFKNLWLEYDILDPDGSIPKPFIFLSYNEMPSDSSIKSAIVQQTLRDLQNSYSFEVRKQLEKCILTLPVYSKIYAIGAMSTRYDNALRLGIIFTSSIHLTEYLEKINWSGSKEELDYVLSLIDFCDGYLLGLDISSTLKPKIGIEMVVGPKDRIIKLKKFVDLLIEKGICDNNKGEALLAWEGNGIDFKMNRKVTRWVSYIKFVVEINKPIQLKSYLFFKYS